MELTITNFNGVETIDSRFVAKAIDQEHYDLIKDIRRYSGFLTDEKISVSDFFIKSNYKDSAGRILPCYLCTRKGCEMIVANAETLSSDWKNKILPKAAEMISGEKLLSLPESEKNYSATEIGEMFGISAQKVDKIANASGMKTSEYGKFYKDKSKYSNKEVDTFHYNDKAIEKFKEIFN